MLLYSSILRQTPKPSRIDVAAQRGQEGADTRGFYWSGEKQSISVSEVLMISQDDIEGAEDFMSIRKIPFQRREYLTGENPLTTTSDENRLEDPQVAEHVKGIRETLLTDRGLHDRASKFHFA